MATGLVLRALGGNFTKNRGSIVGHDPLAFQSTFYRGVNGVMALDNFGAPAPEFVGSGAIFGSSGVLLSNASGFDTGVILDQPFTLMIVGQLPANAGPNTHMTSFVGGAGYNGFLTQGANAETFSIRRPNLADTQIALPITRNDFVFYAAGVAGDGTAAVYTGSANTLEKTPVAGVGGFSADTNSMKINVVGVDADDFAGAKPMSVVATAFYKGTPLTDDQVLLRYQAYKKMFDASLPNPL